MNQEHVSLKGLIRIRGINLVKMNFFVEKPSRYGAQIFRKGIRKFWTESSKREKLLIKP